MLEDRAIKISNSDLDMSSRPLSHSFERNVSRLSTRRLQPRRREGVLGKIETISHTLRPAVSFIERGQAKDGLAEFHEAHMRIDL